MNLDFGPTSNTKGNTFRIYPQIVNRNLALAVWRYSRICGLMLKLPHFRKDYLVPETKVTRPLAARTSFANGSACCVTRG